MGVSFAKFKNLVSLWFGNREMQIVMVGLDAAGKTTILYKLKLGEVAATIPTIGFNVETVRYKGISFTVWDVGGQDKLRPLWKHYYTNAQGLIFVIDSSDRERVTEAREELGKMLSEEQLRDVVLLVFANKQDLPNAMTVEEITEGLGLHAMRERPWYVQPASGIGPPQPFYEGLDWLSAQTATSKQHAQPTLSALDSSLDLLNNDMQYFIPYLFVLAFFMLAITCLKKLYRFQKPLQGLQEPLVREKSQRRCHIRTASRLLVQTSTT